MRRRAICQNWTLSRIHRLLRPLRTKVAALAATLRKEQQCRLAASSTAATTAPTPTPTRLRPPLRRTYQTRKRKRGEGVLSDEDGQYLPQPARASKSRNKPVEKVERKWSSDVTERIGAVVDAFRVLADVVYDEQMETEGMERSSVLSLRDMCVRAVAEDIEPSAIAAAAEEDEEDDSGDLVDATKVVDERFEEIPEHLRRVAIIPYVLSMIKQRIDTISPLPQLWNHILAICLSSSAASSATNNADVLQVCSNLFLASLRQPRSSSRGLASVYRNIVGPGPDKMSPELFCRTVLSELVPPPHTLEDDYVLPPNYLAQFMPSPGANATRSPMKTPSRPTRNRPIPPTPPTYDPFSNQSDDPLGVLFPIRAVLSRPVAHLVAELGPAELLAFVETTACALLKWIESDEMVAGSRLREHRADCLVSGSQKKMSDIRSLAPRVCARIADWTSMALADVWTWSTQLGAEVSMLGRTSLAIGRVVDAIGDHDGTRAVWVDVGDPFCALACVCLSTRSTGVHSSRLTSTLGRLPLTARNCNILAGTLVTLDDQESIRIMRTCTRSLIQAQCPQLAATLAQLVLHEQMQADCEVEEMLEDAEARWDALSEDDWRWARSKWRWDEITNTWVESTKPMVGLEYVPRATKKMEKKKRKAAEAIVVSSDTEMMDLDGDEDDVFAAIPAVTKYAIQRRRRSSIRPRLPTRRSYTISSDAESEGSVSDTTPKPGASRRSSFLVEGSCDEDDDAEYESSASASASSNSGSDSDSESAESDFDWSQYNGRYHPHDRISSGGTKDIPKPALVHPKAPPRRPVPAARTVPKPARVVSAPAIVPIPARICAPIKKQRLVVELPLFKRRPMVSSKASKPRVLGNHNSNTAPQPARRASEHIKPAATSAISSLCRQFSSMSSDDDREYIDVDEVVEGTENEDEAEKGMPSSDDMDLFQIVTPVPRRVRSIGYRG
ncbi:hypothetical protein RhiJN_26615 [Ceratobasidium sp. AG-Ba]|nr:hypothetical protein RhiJN_26615 [Ceratobasidium sp. AG-Ba]